MNNFNNKTVMFESKLIGEERPVFISLPKYYDSKGSYPVVYMMDGDEKFIEGAVSSIRYLEYLRMIPEVILVAIPNTNRDRDVFPIKFTARDGREVNGQADVFLDFIADELAPYIENEYGGNPYRILYGTSNSALTVIHSLITKPERFDAYIASSPTLIPRMIPEENISKFFNEYTGNSKLVYVSASDNDLGPIYTWTQNLENQYKESNQEKIDITFGYYKGQGHCPPQTMHDGLNMIYDGWQLSADAGNLDEIQKHYKRLSERFGYSVNPTADLLITTGYMLLREKEYENSIECFIYCTKLYPTSWNGFDSLGEAYEKSGEMENALKAYKRASELAPENENIKKRIENIENQNKS